MPVRWESVIMLVASDAQIDQREERHAWRVAIDNMHVRPIIFCVASNVRMSRSKEKHVPTVVSINMSFLRRAVVPRLMVMVHRSIGQPFGRNCLRRCHLPDEFYVNPRRCCICVSKQSFLSEILTVYRRAHARRKAISCVVGARDKPRLLPAKWPTGKSPTVTP